MSHPNERDTFFVDAAWADVKLPQYIGPFETEGEAWKWIELNVTNGSATVKSLCWPYLHPRQNRLT